MLELLADPRVDVVVSDQCEYGLMTPDANGHPVPAKKPTQWASSSPRRLKRLSKRCSGDHRRQHLVGGRAKQAALYPLPLSVEILRGMRDEADHKQQTLDNDDMDINMVTAIHATMPKPTDNHKPHNDSMKLADQNRAQKTEATFMDGTSKTISFTNFRKSYKDEYTQDNSTIT